MKLLVSPSRLVARVGLAVGLALLAGVLLTVSIAVSAEPARLPKAPTPTAADSGAPAPMTRTARPAPAAQALTGPAARVASASPLRLAEAWHGSPLTRIFGATGSPDPAKAVRRAWERARDAGAYRFTSDLVQLLYPAPSIANAGSIPQREELHLEGDVDLAAQVMNMKLWRGGGSVAGSGDGAEMRVENGKAYMRRLAGGAEGGAWQETDDFSSSFAPNSDALAFLSGIKNVVELAAHDEANAGLVSRRYAFDIDGPALARYLRDRLEAQLTAQGKLPQGVTLDTPQQYRDATGHGELWLDAAGLPLRLSVRLVYPEARSGMHVEADVKTDFSGFPAPLAAAPAFFDRPIDWTASAVSLTQHPDAWTAAGRLLFALALGVAVLALLVGPRRRRKLYAAVVVTVILSMVVAPLLQSERVAAFNQELAAKQAQQDQQEQTREAARQVQAELAGPAFDPHRDPLAQPAAAPESGSAPGPLAAPGVQAGNAPSTPLVGAPPAPPDCTGQDTNDRDEDGLNNYEECMRGLGTTLATGGAEATDVPDHDGDGLLDGLEVYQLGTDVTLPDTDADWITDTLEVQGYPYGDSTWYLNPLKADTDGDGLPDSAECPELLGVDPADGSTFDIGLCDTDHDGTPDPWDLDSDNDRVPDSRDLSPISWIDQDGYHPTAAEDGTITAFAAPAVPPGAVDPRFAFAVEDLQTVRPWALLVDLQLRPVNPEHLNYALSVLDWPSTISEGQIQHLRTTTFADLPETRITDDEAAAHGDMQLVPMLEVEMNGNTVPLALAPAAATVQVGAGALATTITLEPDSGATKLTITPAGAKPSVKIYSGACLNKGVEVDPDPTLTDVFLGRMVDLADGDHAIEVSDGTTTACTEIPNIVNGPYIDQMVDIAVLEPYGISVQELGSDSTTLLMYVPLNLVTDDTGGGRTAFAAHMLYYPAATAIPVQYVKLVWAVQAITDQCDTSAPDFPKDLGQYQQIRGNEDAKQSDYDAYYRTYCEDLAHRTPDTPRVVQTYDDNWYLTGMSVREDHGLYVAAAYENPDAHPVYASPEEDLWNLSLGLGGSFLSQRDCEKPTAAPPVTYDAGNAASYDPVTGKCSDDGLRDLTVAKRDPLDAAVVGNSTIAERFDAATDEGFHYSSADSFGNPLDSLRVQTEKYAYQDEIVDVATRQTAPILNQLKAKYATADPTFTPTILYAREEYFRSASLDTGSFASRLLTVKVTGTEQLLTAMNWETFRYNSDSDPITGAVIGWEGIPLSEAWADLQDQFAVYFDNLYHPGTDEERQANAGRVKIALSYYLAMTQGLVNMADPCPDLTCKVKPTGNSSVDIAKGIQAAGKGVANVIRVALEEMMAWTARMGVIVKELEMLTILEGGIGKGIGPLSVIGPGGFQKTIGVTALAAGLVVAGGLACLAIMLASAAKNGDTVKVIADVLLATGLILTGFGVITAMGRVVRAVAEKGSLAKVRQAALGLSTNLKNSWELTKCLTTVVAIAMNFLVFMMQWGSGMAVGSLGWDSALAGAIAGSLAAMLMWVIFNAFGPIGTLVQAIIALVDMVVGFICTLTDAYEKQPVVAKWFCGGVTGLITNLYKSAIYSGNVMVDMKAKDRVQFSGWNYAVVHQERGIVAGNAINIKVNVTSTVTMAKFPYDSLWADIWNNQWKDANVKKSNFKYVWKDYDWATVDPQYGAATTLWQPTTTAHQFELLQPANSTQGFPLGNPGIRSLKAYLIEGYAVPEQECWGVWPAGGCWVHENTDSNAYEIGSSMVFAVLPATLDGFRTLAAKGQGYAQSWGNISFPVLYDADNDGLPYSSDGDDHVADRDGDGLLDGYEIEIGSNPAAADSDGDGLNDRFEILAGADPNLADTDGDGLTDGEEVGRQDLQDTDHDGNTAEWLGGWQFVYAYDKTTGAPRKAWVWSDPLSVDADGDTLTDAQERVYGYHPGVKSSLNILTIDTQFNEWDKASGGYIPSDGMVQPTQNLYYVATVTNQLLSREAEGLLSTEVSSGIGEGDMPDRPFVLRPQEQSSTSGSVNFSRAPESGVYSVDQEAGATISDWSTTAGGMILWLPFNDPNAPGFDRSGNLPPHDGTCYSGRGVASWAGCALDPNGIYGNGLRLDGESFLESTVELPQFGGAVALWFKTTSTGSRDLVNTPLLTGSNPFWIYIDGGVLHSVMGAAVAPSSAIAAGPGTLPGYADGKWHHVVVTYGRATPAGSAELHKLYVDGQLKGAGTASQLVAPASSGIDLGGQKNIDTTYSRWLPGMIDDVRVYDHRLSQREVADLYGHVAFSMDFNPANPWQDTSGQGATVGCLTGYCPSVSSSGAGFDGAQYLTASGAIPNLSSGRLTLSAWIYPQNRGDAKDGWYQGILGYHSTLGDSTAYPTLERYGLKLRFGFSAGTAWKGLTTANNVLTANAWNHVVASYSQDDGYARIYVNGAEVQNSNVGKFATIVSPASFDIGRSTNLTKLTATSVHVYTTSDDSRDCPPLYPPEDEICLAVHSPTVGSPAQALGGTSSVCESSNPDPINKSHTFTGPGSVTLDMWEDDGGAQVCGPVRDSDDDTGTLSPTNNFAWNAVGNGTSFKVTYTTEKGNGYFNLKLDNASIPFYGQIDDVQVYNRALNAAEVEALHAPPSLALRLPFDEPPGAAVFNQSGGGTIQAGCTHCPTAGVPGRLDRAVAFDGSSNYLALPNGPVNRLTSGFTIAAWIKADSVAGSHTIVATAQPASDDGYWFGISDGKLRFVKHPDHYYTSTSLTLQPGRWHHVAAAVSSSGSVDFYLDGRQETVPGSSLVQPDTDEDLLVGVRWAARSTGPDQYFDGTIDDVQIHDWYFSADQVKTLIDQAPVMHMRLDELQNATQFADSARYNVSARCSGEGACPLTGEAVRGKVGLAGRFDGQNDMLALDDPDAALLPSAFTIGGWVKPAGLKPTPQPILAKYDPSGAAFSVLRLRADTGVPELLRGCPPVSSVAGPLPLVQNQWNQVLGTYDGATLRLYVNGREVSNQASPPEACANNFGTVYIGGEPVNTANRLAGDLDELIVYNHALSADEIAALYAYQLSWTEDRASTPFKVDRDSPTARILLTGTPVYPNAPVVIPIGTSDATSGVASAALCEGASCGAPAPHCQDPGQTTAWCPMFTPPGEGVFHLSARVTDRVGYMATSASHEVHIDDTPPEVSFSGSAGDLLNAVRDSNNQWTVRLSGTASDPDLGDTSTPGSGVPPDGVRVTLYKADGGLAGAAAQTAALTDGAWTVDYVLSDSEPSGCYTAEAVAVDKLAATYPDEAAKHTGTATKDFGIGTVPPAVQIDRSFLTESQTLGGTLAGAVSGNFLPVALSWTTGAGGAQAGLTLTCQGPGNAETKYTAYQPGSALDASQSYTWAGQVHRQATCDLTLTAAPGSPGIVSGSATVCGEEVASWTNNEQESYPTSFTASSSQCVPDQCSGVTLKSGVSKVEVAFTPLMPGSAFNNEAPPAGEVLHLTLDAGLDGNGNPTFPDVSPGRLTGVCSGATCPQVGRQGHSGAAALFDGVDDAVTLPSFGAFTSATASAWIKRSGANTSRETVLSYKELDYCGFVLSLNEDGKSQFPRFWVRVQPASGSASWQYAESTAAVTANTWEHLAGTYDGETIRLYRNGSQVASKTAPGTMVQCSRTSSVGSRASNDQHRFPGLIDEVRVFDHALTDSEVKRLLYLGTGPVLALPFEEQRATGGSEQEDTSGWQHHAVLDTGAADVGNKAASGQVGSYALQFDGVDDSAAIPDSDALDFDNNQDFAIMAWIKPAQVQAWTATVDNNVVEKWSGSAGYPYSIRYLNQTAGANAGKISAGRWDGTNGPWLQSTIRIDDGRFHHVAFVKSGSTLTFYVDGTRQGQRTDTTSAATANTSPLYIGRRGGTALQGYFTGSVDDVRIYPRGLPAEEVQEQYLAGWRDTTLTAGSGATSARWSVTVPTGLEGTYRVDGRATDTAGRSQVAPVWNTAELSSPTWSGNADNTGPRVTVCKALVSGSTYRYVAVAQDYNLAETGFTFICPITGRSTYQSPGFLAVVPAGTEKLYQLTADCQSNTTATVQARACDSSNNCTTADATTGGACTAIMATQAAAALTASAATAEVAQAMAAAVAAGRPCKPVVAFASAVLTATQYHDPRALSIEGTVSGTDEFSGVELTIGGTAFPAILSEPAATWPFTRTWSSTYLLPDGPLPDGVTRQAVATATLQGGREASADASLTLDVVPPAAVDLTLTENGSPLGPNAIVRTVAPELALSWTSGRDGSGLKGYMTRWTATSAETTTVTTRTFGPTGPLADNFTAGEAQQLTVELGSQDAHGNVRWQQAGPITLDSPKTPDYIALDAHGWQESGCTLMGTDRRLYRNGLSDAPQQLYASWDREALRLAWSGASWHLGDGDLFVYFDTGPGGTTQPFIPVALSVADATVTLPATLQADVLIWAQTADQATLLRWDGSAWSGPTPLTARQFHFDAERLGGQLDMVLPFDLLGLTSASSLGLIGLGVQEPVEDEAPKLWVTLPPFNPVNSPLVSRLAGLAGGDLQFSLQQEYRWPGLGDGVCPNGTDGSLPATRQGDSDLQVSIEAEPQGTVFGGQADGLFWVTDPGESALPAGERLASRLLQPDNPPVADGQLLSYTVHYQNRGTAAAMGVYVQLAGYGHISGVPTTLNLGDVSPGGTGDVTFQAVVDRSQGLLPIAGVLARLYDASHGPDGPALDWLSVAHRVDRGEPEAPLLALPSRVGPLREIFTGRALDEAGIKKVTLQLKWDGGEQSIDCPVARPADGDWACNWDAGSPLPEGTPVEVRAQATDSYDQTSPWSDWRTITVDAQPPITTLDVAASTGAAQGDTVRGGLTLYGTAADAGDVTAVTVCLQDVPTGGEETCRRAEQQPGGGWSYRVPALGALDSVSRTVTIWATDDLGNRTGTPLSQELRIDNVAPVLAANQLLTTLVFSRTATVLGGTATDGGPLVDVSVRVQPPEGDEFRADTLQTGNDWSFDLTATEPGRYQFWVDADDQAGNRTSAGPFVIDVTCTDASPVVAALSAEPALTGTLSLTLTAQLTNTGADPLPAGVPFTFYARDAAIATITTTQSLTATAALGLALDWSPGTHGDWDVVVAPNVGERTLGDAVLCRIPDAAHFTVSLADVPLVTAWNLISLSVQPDNPDIQVVQRPIQGSYAAILGYQGGLRRYNPLGPDKGDLTAVEAGRGYWIRETLPAPPPDAEEPWQVRPVATLRLAGQRVPVDRPLALAAGWNLAGYLPEASLPMMAAFGSIEGAYGAVLGFDRTGVSYYPDLEGDYNTLAELRPSAGYWISATRAITLHFPITASLAVTRSVRLTDTLSLSERLAVIRAAEQVADVQPTYTWANLYGQVNLDDGTPAPISTTLTALVNGRPCGATLVTEPGRFGLLACYGDDETTVAVDGAQPGNAITLLLNGAPASLRPLSFNGKPVPAGRAVVWTALGDRWEVVAGNAPVVDLALIKTVTPTVATPGDVITYTLVYTNTGARLAAGVVITDLLPVEISAPTFTSGGEVVETDDGQIITWQVAELAPDAGSVITVTGVVSPALKGGVTITNTARISGPGDAMLGNNWAQAVLKVAEVPAVLKPAIWLPWIARQ